MDQKMDPQSAKPVKDSKDCTGPYWFLAVFCFAPIVKSIVGKKDLLKKVYCKEQGVNSVEKWSCYIATHFYYFPVLYRVARGRLLSGLRTAHGKQGVEEKGGKSHPVETETWQWQSHPFQTTRRCSPLCRCVDVFRPIGYY